MFVVFERFLTWNSAKLLLHLRQGEISALLHVLRSVPGVPWEVLSIVLLGHREGGGVHLVFLYNEIIIHKSNQTSNDLIRPRSATIYVVLLLRGDARIDRDPELPELLHLPAELLRPPALMADVVHISHILYVQVLLLLLLLLLRC